jgi:transcriptional regulator with XRE-family HTH domain
VTGPGLPALDVAKLAAALEERRQQRTRRSGKPISWRQVAREAGVSPSTTTRLLKHGQRPDVAGLVRLLAWLGTYDLGAYVAMPDGSDPLLALPPGEYRDAGPALSAVARYVAKLAEIHESLGLPAPSLVETQRGTARVYCPPGSLGWAWRCDGSLGSMFDGGCPGWIGVGLDSRDAAEREARQHLDSEHPRRPS